MADGDVWSAIWTVDDGHRITPQYVGSWVLWRGGEAHDLGTPSLTEALASLGVDAVAGGPAPDEPASFYGTLSDLQQATLNNWQYATPATIDDSVDSFYNALIQVASASIQPLLHSDRAAVTPADVRAAVAAAVAADFADGAPRYGHLITGSRTRDEVVADLLDTDVWTRQATVLVPHVAADVFGLDLGVLGGLGIPEAVGDPFGSRRGDGNGDPFLLVNIGERFLPATRRRSSRVRLRPGGPPRPVRRGMPVSSPDAPTTTTPARPGRDG